MQLTAISTRRAHRTAPRAPSGTPPSGASTGHRPVPRPVPRPSRARARRDADGMAVAAFVLGLVGLLVMNILLGPIAIVLAASPSGAAPHAAAAPCSDSPSASPIWPSSPY